ncbi:uncharacterized protein LOC105393862 [Plutella xylostella]|uniref:uncharacterized protein LOC105393862 n=1 Tax=Plutella xylostella TaxID=51655 RepID=UPI002032A92E|nr:uncharacterized protein LOC105393862 [Plutella xylostella]
MPCAASHSMRPGLSLSCRKLRQPLSIHAPVIASTPITPYTGAVIPKSAGDCEMTTTNIGHVVANSLLMVANLLSHQSATKVTKVTVPELTQTNSSALILDCEFSVPDENFVLQWLFNGERPPVYEWRPNTEPVVVDLLRDRLDVQYKAADSPSIGRRSLRILRPGPELSGDYTCLVRSDAGAEDHATKTVLVFSPEHEFVLTIDYAEEFEVNCIARGLYPQPTLVLERNR